MKYVLLLCLLYTDVPKNQGVVEHVDFIELNHVYDEKGKVTLDQVILWEWVENADRTALIKVVVTWYSLPAKTYREKLTREEWLKKNRAFGDKWVKKHGFNTFIPDYNPEFIGGIMCPRYDVARKKWVVLYIYNRKINKIYGDGYIETWTQFDPELENREILPINKRRKFQQKNSLRRIMHR